MFTKSLIGTALLLVLCIKFGQGLQCYEHDLCVGDTCKAIMNRTTTCKKGDDKCWKVSFIGGTQRGCGDGECKVTGVVGFLDAANVCCSTDFCNSARQTSITTIVIFAMSLIAFINRL